MWLELGRRVSIIMLIVAVATGFTAPIVQANSHRGQIVATVIMSADHLAGCAHDGCPIEQGTDMHGTCFAPCAGVSVLSTAAAMVYLPAAVERTLTPAQGAKQVPCISVPCS